MRVFAASSKRVGVTPFPNERFVRSAGVSFAEAERVSGLVSSESSTGAVDERHAIPVKGELRQLSDVPSLRHRKESRVQQTVDEPTQSMSDWQSQLKSALLAVPRDIDNKALLCACRDILRDRVVSDHKALIKFWCESYEKEFGFPYVFLAKDAAAVKKLLASLDMERLVRIFKAAWVQRDVYPCSASKTLTGLLSKINEIRDALNAQRNGKAPAKSMPAFKQLEILKSEKAKHPCNCNSVKYDESLCTPDRRKEYAELKKKIMDLEQSELQRARA